MIIQRLIDLMLSFPIVVLAIVVIAVFPRTVVAGIDINVIIAIAIPFTPKVARVIRSQALTIVTLPYVDAAKSAGFSATRTIFRHILPNVTAPYLIMLTAFIGQACPINAVSIIRYGAVTLGNICLNIVLVAEKPADFAASTYGKVTIVNACDLITLATFGVNGIAIAMITFISIPATTVLGKTAITTIAKTTIGNDNIRSISL